MDRGHIGANGTNRSRKESRKERKRAHREKIAAEKLKSDKVCVDRKAGYFHSVLCALRFLL